ncbi:MAG: hypothetical protein Q9186_005426 [Xanthomendoza sp. 1 TL-2023]
MFPSRRRHRLESVTMLETVNALRLLGKRLSGLLVTAGTLGIAPLLSEDPLRRILEAYRQMDILEPTLWDEWILGRSASDEQWSQQTRARQGLKRRLVKYLELELCQVVKV